MAECNSIDSNSVEASDLNNQHFRLNKTNEVKDYFIAEIKERKSISKRISEYTASFDYFNISLIALSATSSSISIALFATVIGKPVGIACASLNLTFLLSTGLVKKLLITTRNKKKKHNKIVISMPLRAGSKKSCFFQY